MAYDLKRLNVLIIEDDPSMRSLLGDLLNAIGIKKIETAADGSAGYTALRHFPADIVITDWIMEPLDGVEFTKMVRTAPDSPNPFIPIIMLTSRNEMKDVVEARDSGVTEYLIKPVTANSLYSRIVMAIEQPRQFLRVSEYFGPDRRRTIKDFMGEDKRGEEEAE